MEKSASAPLRVGAVDMGSNAIRLEVAEFGATGARVQVEYERVAVRLGESAFLSGRLSDDRVEEAVAALARFRRRMEELGVGRYRAVATSAVRESSNGGVLVERAEREAGIRVEPITGAEEARLVWRAVREQGPLEGRWCLADLGGGSLEVSVVGPDGIEGSESHPIGTVRLLEELGGEDPSHDEIRALLDDHFGELRLPESADGRSGRSPESPRGLLATGGNIEALAELAARWGQGPGGGSGTGGGSPPTHGGEPKKWSRLTRSDLDKTIARLERLTTRKRISKLGLRPDRADVIVPAGHIYRRVAELCSADEIVVPYVGVKDGILLELASTASGPPTPPG